ncbi:Mu transposase domain-containing protein [Mangrovicoccus ximenensis]|uniref:Mu transposase domain-containing protein n=1 Tax=Mangrovicoccus ximenensis TaxID=1911570 RepID=UPI000D3398F0|nr:hypothetical protein [Mangrovicoccus ximenensis]
MGDRKNRAAVPLHPAGRSALQAVRRTVCHALECLARSFRNLDDLNAQFDAWRIEVANPRVQATTRRIAGQALAEEKPAIPYDAGLAIERRVSREGMVPVGGNLHSVPDAAQKRMLEVQRRLAPVPTMSGNLGLSNLFVHRLPGMQKRPGGRFPGPETGPRSMPVEAGGMQVSGSLRNAAGLTRRKLFPCAKKPAAAKIDKSSPKAELMIRQ